MLLFQDNYHSGGLRVEGAGNVLDGVGDELFDAGVGDGGFVGQLVVSATGFGGVEEILGACCHLGGCCCCCVLWLRGGVCLLGARREEREEGGRKDTFIVVGQDLLEGTGEGHRLPKQMLRLLHCHVADKRGLDQ